MAHIKTSSERELRIYQEKYEKILADDPGSLAFIFLAQVLYKQQRLDKALGVLAKGLRHNKDNVSGRFLLGKIYNEMWMIDQAKKEFKTVIKLAPDNLAASKALVEILKSEENYEKALEVLDSIHMFHPTDEYIISEIDEVRSKIAGLGTSKVLDINANEQIDKKYIAEKTDYNKNTEDPNSLVTETMADVYINQGLFDKAASILQEILINDPHNISVMKKLEISKSKVISQSLGLDS